MPLSYQVAAWPFRKTEIDSQKRLALPEDKYWGVFENANDGIIILRNPELLISDINKEVEELTGYKKGDLFQKEILDGLMEGVSLKILFF